MDGQASYNHDTRCNYPRPLCPLPPACVRACVRLSHQFVTDALGQTLSGVLGGYPEEARAAAGGSASYAGTATEQIQGAKVEEDDQMKVRQELLAAAGVFNVLFVASAGLICDEDVMGLVRAEETFDIATDIFCGEQAGASTVTTPGTAAMCVRVCACVCSRARM
eukprot:GHVU01094291.1.p2 GENE.GHVU01094291.1~~GHVU01094291.1.p2  ORF type:complete len:165 (+),score=23.01 GHVU01094291.1:465-959(+)